MGGDRFRYDGKTKPRTNASTMKNQPEEPLPSLAELEAEAEAYARQMGREYLQERLQHLAETHGEVPPKASASYGTGGGEGCRRGPSSETLNCRCGTGRIRSMSIGAGRRFSPDLEYENRPLAEGRRTGRFLSRQPTFVASP